MSLIDKTINNVSRSSDMAPPNQREISHNEARRAYGQNAKELFKAFRQYNKNERDKLYKK